MKVIITYVADDGMEFETARECVEWEWHISHFPRSFHFFDGEGNELLPTSSTQAEHYLFNLAEEMEILGTSTYKKDAEWMEEYWGLEVTGLEPGQYHYDHVSDQWILDAPINKCFRKEEIY